MRSSSQVERDRRHGREAFERDRAAAAAPGPGHGAAREARMEQERRDAVRERELAALQAAALTATDPGDRPRVVLVHRTAWTRDALQRGLEDAGMVVVAAHEDGATGLGAVVAEQPDLVVVQEQLPWRDGLDVVRDVRRFAPSTTVTVHLDRPAGADAAREAGAQAAFPRSTRPADLVQALVALVPTAVPVDA